MRMVLMLDLKVDVTINEKLFYIYVAYLEKDFSMR